MEALREYLRLRGISQAVLARELEVNQGQLNHWLNKRRAPTVANLKRIASKTGIKLERLAKDL
jgi:transcriptional regulator with XRE-family HTH domain